MRSDGALQTLQSLWVTGCSFLPLLCLAESKTQRAPSQRLRNKRQGQSTALCHLDSEQQKKAGAGCFGPETLHLGGDECRIQTDGGCFAESKISSQSPARRCAAAEHTRPREPAGTDSGPRPTRPEPLPAAKEKGRCRCRCQLPSGRSSGPAGTGDSRGRVASRVIGAWRLLPGTGTSRERRQPQRSSGSPAGSVPSRTGTSRRRLLPSGHLSAPAPVPADRRSPEQAPGSPAHRSESSTGVATSRSRRQPLRCRLTPAQPPDIPYRLGTSRARPGPAGARRRAPTPAHPPLSEPGTGGSGAPRGQRRRRGCRERGPFKATQRRPRAAPRDNRSPATSPPAQPIAATPAHTKGGGARHSPALTGALPQTGAPAAPPFLPPPAGRASAPPALPGTAPPVPGRGRPQDRREHGGHVLDPSRPLLPGGAVPGGSQPAPWVREAAAITGGAEPSSATGCERRAWAGRGRHSAAFANVYLAGCLRWGLCLAF